MIKDIAEIVASKWGIAAIVLLAMPGGRKLLRSAAKEAIRAGITISEGVKDLAAEIKEEASDVVAEVKAERAGDTKEKHKLKAEH